MRISDWSSDVCSSDLKIGQFVHRFGKDVLHARAQPASTSFQFDCLSGDRMERFIGDFEIDPFDFEEGLKLPDQGVFRLGRSEEHTSELQSLMRISYAVFCLKKNSNISYVTLIHVCHQHLFNLLHT